MSKIRLGSRFTIAGLVFLSLIAFIFASGLLSGRAQERSGQSGEIGQPLGPTPGSAYRQTNYISDVAGIAFVQDPQLVNPWGISLTTASPFWVSNNGSSKSTLYRSATPFDTMTINAGLNTITIPGGLPTGTVSNPTADFVLPGACASPPCKANFIFASITGNITGWNTNAPAAGSTTAVIAASQPGHVYTGLAIGSNSGGNRLYAADFANGNIDVYGPAYALTTVSGAFADPTIPTTSGNVYHPFNIQAIGSSLYVMYAKVGPDGRSEDGVGNGFVRRFDTDGVRDLTFGINNGPLNAPWGVAVAPPSFGIFGGALLIGNFGEGNPSIHAFSATTGAFLGTLQDEGGDGVVIDEMWALTFGNGGNGGSPNTLYFSAGIGEEEHGLIGALRPTTSPTFVLARFSSDDYLVNETNASINITIIRSGDTTGSTTVNYAPFIENQPGHADASDFTLAPGTVSFGPGETSKTFAISINNDLLLEGDETLDIVLSNPVGAGLAQPNIAELTIREVTASVSGQVVTNLGQGLKNALVTITDEQSGSRTLTTTSFGYFQFDQVLVGHTYTVSIGSKRYTFTPQNVAVTGNVSDLVFTGTPN
jgi:uncharacterized protein (TIGR03118 family)